MQGAILVGAQMQGADLRKAQMDSATSLNAATFEAAALREVDYTDVNISQAQVDAVFYDWSVRFASGTIRAPDREAVLYDKDFYDQWRAWQKSIGYDPG